MSFIVELKNQFQAFVLGFLHLILIRGLLDHLEEAYRIIADRNCWSLWASVEHDLNCYYNEIDDEYTAFRLQEECSNIERLFDINQAYGTPENILLHGSYLAGLVFKRDFRLFKKFNIILKDFDLNWHADLHTCAGMGNENNLQIWIERVHFLGGTQRNWERFCYVLPEAKERREFFEVLLELEYGS